MLFQRLLPVSANAAEKKQASKENSAGLEFDLGINKWVAKDRSWAYEVTLDQLFDYVVDGIIDGEPEVAARLKAAASDPVGDDAADGAAIDAFVSDLRAVRNSEDPRIRALLGSRFELCFATTDGGSKPVGAQWQLPLRLTADLFAAMGDGAFRDELRKLAETERETERARKQAVLAPLGDLLTKHNGVPRRHKRAHAALINLGLAGQSVRDMAKDGGVLPRSKTLLDPATLKSLYGAADHVKLRFLFTDELELFVVGDALFQEVVDKHHFPPNHELLSYNRPIAGSGYLTIDRGRIVGLEDDITMLPGKLPDNLPPALEVLRARGFDLDEEKIRESSLVLDWDGFARLSAAPSTRALQGDVDPRHVLMECSHAERPEWILSLLKTRLGHERKEAGDEKLAQSRTAEYAAEMLKGFRIINVAARDFQNGGLPPELNEFSELMIDGTLAPYLVRKVAG
jgi:hypothetical protein